MRPRIVDLRDLGHRYAWHPRAIQRFLARTNLAVGSAARQAFVPPGVLVLIAPYAEPKMLLRSRAWLAASAHLVIVRDGVEDTAIWSDPELRESCELDWREVLAALPPAATFDWFTDDDAGCREAIAHA
ncbi:MAG: hypothetical protein H0T79_05725, partial [Deltaproteobacteria bacterium]|nr:hypothetical protein [Deltaproteobacteria bacterium]